MGVAFWIRRFAVAFFLSFGAIAASHLLRSRGIEYAFTEAGLWATATAVVFCAALRYRLHRGEACAMCRDADATTAPEERP